MKAALLATVAVMIASTAQADQILGLDYSKTESQSVTTQTSQQSMPTGNDTYIYHQNQSFQPNSIGNTNPGNVPTVTDTFGVGTTF